MGYEYGDNSIDAYSGQVYTDGKENFMTEMISAFDSRKNKEREKVKRTVYHYPYSAPIRIPCLAHCIVTRMHFWIYMEVYIQMIHR